MVVQFHVSLILFSGCVAQFRHCPPNGSGRVTKDRVLACITSADSLLVKASHPAKPRVKVWEKTVKCMPNSIDTGYSEKLGPLFSLAPNGHNTFLQEIMEFKFETFLFFNYFSSKSSILDLLSHHPFAVI